MRALGCYKDFELSPLVGAMDTRSASGSVAFTDVRLRLNMGCSEAGKMCRLGGWQKLLADSPWGFLNNDLHDHLLDCSFYYQSIHETIIGPSQLTGYSYPYFSPTRTFPASSDNMVSEQLYPGDYEFYVNNPYPYSLVEDQWRICFPLDGYPEVSVQNYGVPNTGAPYYYGYPFFHLCFFTQEEGYTIPGYSYGQQQGVYSNPYAYVREYCGDYLYRLTGCREAVTLLFESVSVAGRRQLIAGTKSRLSLLNEKTGNWRILADGLGGLYQPDDNCVCARRRFNAAQLGNTIIFVNDFDPVLFWNVDAPPDGCQFWSAAFVPDLQGLEITRAKVVASWQGFMFIGNVAVNGEPQPSRILWSDFNDPLAYAPGGESVAGSQELGRGERIVAIEPIGGQLRVYTVRGDEKAIYEVILVGGDEVFNFREIYRGPDGVEYENSLVNIGNAHVWFGSSGIMWLGEYDRVPTRPEWLHKASGLFYSGLNSKWVESFDGLNGFGPVNREACEQVVGGYDSERKNIWFSWPTDDNQCPNVSLCINHVYGFSSIVDHGFTAFLMYRPDYRQALREFLAEFAGCDFGLLDKEGEPYSSLTTGTKPAYLKNATEDPNLPADPNSLCARIAGIQLQDLCVVCETMSLFVMASSADMTLKEFMPSQYFRERFIDSGQTLACPYTSVGSYVQEGYHSMAQGDSYDFQTNSSKIINKAIVDFVADVQTTPGLLHFNVGYGANADCLAWDLGEPKEFACSVDYDTTSAEAANERAAELPVFNFYREGKYLAWRFFISGLGSGGCFGGLTLSVRKSSGEWR